MENSVNNSKNSSRREYHRKWRAEHPEAVRAAQMRYWMKQAEQEIARKAAAEAEHEQKRS